MENEVFIYFSNGLEVAAERNGDCFITDGKPEFPDDLSVVTISDLSQEFELHNVEIVECASSDERYWFSFRERTREEMTIQMLTDCILELSQEVYS